MEELQSSSELLIRNQFCCAQIASLLTSVTVPVYCIHESSVKDALTSRLPYELLKCGVIQDYIQGLTNDVNMRNIVTSEIPLNGTVSQQQSVVVQYQAVKVNLWMPFLFNSMYVGFELVQSVVVQFNGKCKPVRLATAAVPCDVIFSYFLEALQMPSSKPFHDIVRLHCNLIL